MEIIITTGLVIYLLYKCFGLHCLIYAFKDIEESDISEEKKDLKLWITVNSIWIHLIIIVIIINYLNI